MPGNAWLHGYYSEGRETNFAASMLVEKACDLQAKWDRRMQYCAIS